MESTHEDHIGADRFCIKPHLGGLPGGTVYKLAPDEDTSSYLTLEVIEPGSASTRVRLGRHLIKEYKLALPRDPLARYDGTLMLNHACCVTNLGFIEPSGESRVL